MEEIKNTKSYITKYKLNKNDKLDHKSFVRDLKCDFNALLTNSIRRTGNMTPAKFEDVVRGIKLKFNSISNKTAGILPEGLWKYFYATVIMTKKESFFGVEA
jgi:hypothetical protein